MIECDGQCVGYADLPNCCNGAAGRCGSLQSPEEVATACAGTTPLITARQGASRVAVLWTTLTSGRRRIKQG